MNDNDLQHLASIVRHSDDAIIGKTLEGIITSWNRGAERIYGYTAEEVLGRTIAMLVPPDREDELPKILQKLAQGEGTNHYDTLRVTKDGRLVNISLTVSPVRDASGVITGASSIGRDVTKEKEAEAALRESARAYKLLMEQASDAIFTADHEGNFLDANSTALEMLGYNKEELLLLNVRDIMSSEDQDKLTAQWEETLYAGNPLVVERRMRRKDGTLFHAESSSKMLDDGRLQAIVRDITERKLAEEALHESEERNRAILEQLSEAIFLIEPDTNRFIVANPAFQNLVGYTLEELLDMQIYDVLPYERERIDRAGARALNEEGYSVSDRFYRRKDGSHVNVEVSITPVTYAGRRVLCEIVRDITERKLTVKALLESEEKFRSYVETTGEWIWSIDLEGRITYSNPAVESILGYHQTELVGQDSLHFMHSEDRKEIEGKLPELIKKKLGWMALIVRWRHKDGSYRYLESNATPLLDEHGNLIGYRGADRDVTERKQSEELLSERTKQLGEAQRLSQTGSWEMDMATNELIWSDAMYSIFGVEPQQFGATYEAFLKRTPPEDANKIREDFERAIREKSSIDSVYRFIRADEGVGYFHARAEIVLDQGSNVVKIRGTAQDVTERREAEDALLKSEGNYRFLVEHMSEGLLQVDTNDVVQFVNDRYCEMVGYTRKELIGKVSKELVVLEEDRPIITEKTLLRAQDVSDRYEVRLRKKSGEVIWVQIGGAPVKDALGNVVGSVGIHSDITARKHAEEASRESEERFQLVARATHDIIWDRNLVTGALWLSKSFDHQIRPIPQPQVLDGNQEAWASRIHPDDREAVMSSMASVLSGNGSNLSNEYRLLQDDGSYSHVLDRGYIIRNAEGEAVRMIGSLMDITERKLFEEALQESEERARAQYKGNPIPTYTWLRIGNEFVLNDYNLAADEITDGGVHTILGKTATDIYRDMPEILEDFERCYRERTIVKREMDYKFITIDKTRHLAFSCVFVPPDIMTVHTEDITERKYTEEVRLTMEAANKASTAKSEFLSRMSHELRTPLNAILGFSELLQIDGPAPNQKQSVDYIVKAGKHLLTLINEVLDIARIEEGHLPLSVEPVLVEDILRESIDLIRPMADRRKIILTTSISTACTKHVMADKQRFRQVLLNLLSNAVKYNHEGGNVTLSCESVAQVDGAHVRVIVNDTGPGISAEDLLKLFMPFERLDAGHSEVEGSGLGLAFSKKLIEAMGGAVGVESTPGQGSTFWVELVVAEGHLQPLQHLATGPLDLQSHVRPARTVLYVEDNISNLRLVEAIMKHRPNVTLLPAIRGEIGLTTAQVHRPDLILLDLNLPDMSGEMVLEKLKENSTTTGIPVVIMSADATPPQVQRLIAAGAAAYITKPINVVSFLKVLDDALKYEHDLATIT